MKTDTDFNTTQKLITEEIAKTLNQIEKKDIETLIESILGSEKVFFVGVGRVLLSLEGIAKRLAHLGVQTCGRADYRAGYY